MREVLGKIEGMTTSTREQLEKQFSTVLEASLGKQGSVVSEAMTQEIAQQVKGVEERLTQVEGNTTSQADLAVQVRGELNRLRGDLSRAAEEMPQMTRDRPEEVFALFWGAGMEGQPVVGSTLVAFAKNVTDHARQVTIHLRTPDHSVMGSSRIVDPGDRHEVEAMLQTPGPAEVEIIDNGTSKRWMRRFAVYSK
jgi:hypothetical protein